MNKYRHRKASFAVVEAMTFDELVQHGRDQGVPIVNGMPWSFTLDGRPVTHENDRCYLVMEAEPEYHMDHRVTPLDVLVRLPIAGLYTVPVGVFNAKYEKIEG